MEQRLSVLRQGMRIRNRNGLPVGFVRDVSGRSVLVGEPQGPRVFWIDGSMVSGVDRGEVVLGTGEPLSPLT
ncbi:MAG: hypothetical protein IT300_06500 [Dehalococcoidia bacterium]|nr:hypothetical protein [Dehalococcoidia bacterium]